MAEKKTTKAATEKKAAAPKKACAKRTCAKKTTKVAVEAPEVSEVEAPVAETPVVEAPVVLATFSLENVGFRAGDIYQALASAKKAMTVAELAAATGMTETEVYLGAGWLMKEGKLLGKEETFLLA